MKLKNIRLKSWPTTRKTIKKEIKKVSHWPSIILFLYSVVFETSDAEKWFDFESRRVDQTWKDDKLWGQMANAQRS